MATQGMENLYIVKKISELSVGESGWLSPGDFVFIEKQLFFNKEANVCSQICLFYDSPFLVPVKRIKSGFDKKSFIFIFLSQDEIIQHVDFEQEGLAEELMEFFVYFMEKPIVEKKMNDYIPCFDRDNQDLFFEHNYLFEEYESIKKKLGEKDIQKILKSKSFDKMSDKELTAVEGYLKIKEEYEKLAELRDFKSKYKNPV
ncbi:MAG: hypothetical protein OEX08_02245 [Candidatus Nomurabacteria bacterium]|nr:hypothetical protein [Candidatus Nomurabacteria bacterium]